MKAKVPLLLVGADDALAERLARALADLAAIAASGPVRESVALYRQKNPAAALICLSGDPEDGIKAAAEITSAGGQVVFVAPSKDPELILSAMRAGAREFLLAGDEDGLREAVRGLGGAPAETPTVETFFSPKGGVGGTTLAVNLAGALARAGERVCLVDLDPHLGNALTFLDLDGAYSLGDVVANMHRLDRDLLNASVTRHSSGLRVLAHSAKIEEAERVRPEQVPALLAFLSTHYRRVVVDGIRGFGDMTLAALDASVRIWLIVTQDVPALRNARRALDIFTRIGLADRVRLVVNRYDRNARLNLALIAENLGVEACAQVANDFPRVAGTIDRGALLVDDPHDAAPIARDIEGLVALVDPSHAVSHRPRRGWFGGLVSRGR